MPGRGGEASEQCRTITCRSPPPQLQLQFSSQLTVFFRSRKQRIWLLKVLIQLSGNLEIRNCLKPRSVGDFIDGQTVCREHIYTHDFLALALAISGNEAYPRIETSGGAGD